MIDGRLLDALDRRGDGHRYYSSFCPDRNYYHHHYHPYRTTDRGYFLYEFEKAKPPTFDGHLKKLEDA